MLNQSHAPAPELERAMRSNKPTSTSTSPKSPKSEFPIKLYAMLELADSIPEFAQAVTWLPHGRAFRVLDQDMFMKDVVPVFFNQTKIRSFNRQLHMWGFRGIGRGNDKVWYHDNFLRGVPESMEHLVRTKIKGNTVDSSSSDDGRVPNFDDMPRLPIRKKQPAAVLDEMEKAILKMQSQSSSIVHCDLTLNSISTLTQASFNDAYHPIVSPGCESPCEFGLYFNDNQSVPFMRFQLPFQADTSEPMTCMNQASFVGTSQSHQVKSQIFQASSNAIYFSPIRQSIEDFDFEPLPFWEYNDCDLSDDFANFIEEAIHQVEL